jgi:hypothetical protein
MTTDTAELQAMIDTRDRVIAGLNARIFRLNGVIVKRDQEIERLQAELAAARNDERELTF